MRRTSSSAGRSIMLSVLSDSDAKAVVVYGTQTTELSARTEAKYFKEGQPQDLILEKLKPDTRYYLLDATTDKPLVDLDRVERAGVLGQVVEGTVVDLIPVDEALPGVVLPGTGTEAEERPMLFRHLQIQRSHAFSVVGRATPIKAWASATSTPADYVGASDASLQRLWMAPQSPSSSGGHGRADVLARHHEVVHGYHPAAGKRPGVGAELLGRARPPIVQAGFAPQVSRDCHTVLCARTDLPTAPEA